MSLKILLLVLVAAAVLYAAYHAVQVYRHIKVSARLVEAAKPFEVERGADAPRLLVVGDSTAVGVGASDSAYTTSGYFAADHPQYAVTNLAKSGATVADVLVQLRSAQGAYAAVLVQAGGNDTIQFSDLTQLRADYAALLSEAKARSGKVVALSTGNVGRAPLFNFFPLNYIYEARTKAVRAIFIDEAAKAGAVYVDLYKEGTSDAISQDPVRHYAADGLHLSDAGWAVWYQDIKRAFDLALQ
ncbi:MAG: SGNH/GDSL hydrolase family protein [Candidatus Pacebacteria bacterium]|nr:SGNH/GDSL hydrolase family protein [Candidatus Paceibacterota bacterium]